MVSFSQRPICYQVGVFLLLGATALFLGGMASPWWAQTYSEAQNQVIRHSGLWQGCSSSAEEECTSIEAPDWFRAVQVLQCTGLVAMLAACAFAVFTNCCLDNVMYSRRLEIMTAAGGVLGVVSCLLYVAKTSHILKTNSHIGYSWAFGIDFGASVLVIFVAVIIALSSSPHVEEESRFIIEDGYVDPRSRPRGLMRSRSRSCGGSKEEIALEKSTGRTRRLGATSGSGREVIVLQNNYNGTPNHCPVNVNSGVCADEPLCTVCACSQRKSSICDASRPSMELQPCKTRPKSEIHPCQEGHHAEPQICEEGQYSEKQTCKVGPYYHKNSRKARQNCCCHDGSCHDEELCQANAQCIETPKCGHSRTSSHSSCRCDADIELCQEGCHHSLEEDPLLSHKNCQCDCVHQPKAQRKGLYSRLPTKALVVAKCEYSSQVKTFATDHVVNPHQSCCVSCQPRCDRQGSPMPNKSKDKSSHGHGDTFKNMTHCHRAVATAPPLEGVEKEDEDHIDLAKAQFFVDSETVFIGGLQRREQ
ncbi:uncharacterized protein [Littorina saxatilis]|uniref:Uncharacterized protein n=1 Tax=Littorina saxatilis TaxID=31220 RepID=A0AAN9BZ32_9CAEN